MRGRSPSSSPTPTGERCARRPAGAQSTRTPRSSPPRTWFPHGATSHHGVCCAMSWTEHAPPPRLDRGSWRAPRHHWWRPIRGSRRNSRSRFHGAARPTVVGHARQPWHARRPCHDHARLPARTQPAHCGVPAVANWAYARAAHPSSSAGAGRDC